MGDKMGHQQNTEQLAWEYYTEGRQTFFDNRLEEAALLIQNAIHLFKKAENYEQYTIALNLMGVIYAATGNETMAIDYYLEGLESALDHHYDHIVALFYNNIGSRYQELNEHEKAIAYFTKSARELENPSCIQQERHDIWCLITYLNLTTSYRELRQYKLAMKYLEKAEPYLEGEDSVYKYTFLISKCRLYWCVGKHDYVYEHLEELLESGVKDCNASDYVQDMKDLCSLLKQMKEYDCWKKIILAVEKYADEQNTVYFRLIQTEMWMDYYQTIGEIKKYIHLCVEHAELYQRQKEIADKERAAAIDIKIELREKEVERRRAEEKSTTDPLTGLGNRYLLEQEAKRMIAESVQEQERIVVGVLDIDCFKQHNDTYGHIQGDHCLKTVADILKRAVEERGQVYRFGGDEFVMLLSPGQDTEVERIAERVKSMLREARIENINSLALPEITISQGYACFVPAEKEHGASLIEHADKALYYVKKNGRNGYHIIEE